MARVIRVRYERGVLKPLEDIDAVEGEVFEVVLVRKSFRGFHEKASRYVFEADRDIVEEFILERR